MRNNGRRYTQTDSCTGFPITWRWYISFGGWWNVIQLKITDSVKSVWFRGHSLHQTLTHYIRNILHHAGTRNLAFCAIDISSFTWLNELEDYACKLTFSCSINCLQLTKHYGLLCERVPLQRKCHSRVPWAAGAPTHVWLRNTFTHCILSSNCIKLVANKCVNSKILEESPRIQFRKWWNAQRCIH